MKKRISFYFIITLAIGLMVGLTNCTKEGPAGPAGANGTNGTNGTDGTDGVDGNATCLQCHTAVMMDDISNAFAEHKHVVGSSWGRGTSASCGRCHSTDAFVEFARSGTEIGAAVSTPLSCGACHGNHASLEDGIGAPMRMVPSPVVSVAVEGATYDHGGGNLCATCHQARRGAASYYGTEDATYERQFTGDDIAMYQAHGAFGPNGSATLVGDTLFVVFDVPVATHVYTNSTHAGPHHGPQANMFAADIGSVPGAPFDRDHHTDCAGCHVQTSTVGSGHTFVPDLAMCDECHGDALDITAEQEAIMVRYHAVEAALENIGAIHVAEDGVHPMYASLEKAKWDAFWNFMVLYEDKSEGVHNFSYAKQLLTQAETALGL